MRLLGTAVAISLLILMVAMSSGFLFCANAAEDVQILSHTGYIDSSGNYHVVGEVENVGTQAVNSVVVNVTFYDSKNVFITYRFDSTMLDIILAGRKSPFDIQLLNTAESALVDHYSINFTYSHTKSIPENLEILNDTSYIDDVGELHVAGEIRNIGTEEALTVKLVVTYYDKTGTVIAAITQYTDPEQPNLVPGQTATFDILLEDSTRESLVANYEITAQSSQYAAIPEFPTWTWLPLTMISVEIAIMIIIKRIKREVGPKRMLPTNGGARATPRAVKNTAIG